MGLHGLLRRLARRTVRFFLLRGVFTRTSSDYLATDGSEATVIMCLWNRPSRIDDVLAMLDRQDYSPGVRLYLWNNNRAEHAYYLAKVAAFAATGALRGVELAKAPYNLGSIGRFYWARFIDKRRPGTPLIVIDDDQDFTKSFVTEALAAFDPEVMAGWWAWTVDGEYWNRRPAEPGDRVDHVGPGGSVLSSEIFADPTFFTGIPDQYGLLDDLWLTYFVKRRGGRLEKLAVDITFVMDETNQHHSQGYVKADFFDYLYPKAK